MRIDTNFGLLAIWYIQAAPLGCPCQGQKARMCALACRAAVQLCKPQQCGGMPAGLMWGLHAQDQRRCDLRIAIQQDFAVAVAGSAAACSRKDPIPTAWCSSKTWRRPDHGSSSFQITTPTHTASQAASSSFVATAANNRGSCRSPFVTPTQALQSDRMARKQTRKRAM